MTFKSCLAGFFGLREFVLGFLTRGPCIQNSHTTGVTQSSLSEKHHCRSHSFCPCFEAVFNGICDFFYMKQENRGQWCWLQRAYDRNLAASYSWSTVRVVTCFNWSMIFVLSWTLCCDTLLNLVRHSESLLHCISKLHVAYLHSSCTSR